MTSTLELSEEFARQEYAKHDAEHQWSHVEDCETHVDESVKVAKDFLLKHNYPEDKTQLVLDTMLAHSSPHRKKLGDSKRIEGKIIYDADKFRLAATPEGLEKYSSKFYLDETREMLLDK